MNAILIGNKPLSEIWSRLKTVFWETTHEGQRPWNVPNEAQLRPIEDCNLSVWLEMQIVQYGVRFVQGGVKFIHNNRKVVQSDREVVQSDAEEMQSSCEAVQSDREVVQSGCETVQSDREDVQTDCEVVQCDREDMLSSVKEDQIKKQILIGDEGGENAAGSHSTPSVRNVRRVG